MNGAAEGARFECEAEDVWEDGAGEGLKVRVGWAELDQAALARLSQLRRHRCSGRGGGAAHIDRGRMVPRRLRRGRNPIADGRRRPRARRGRKGTQGQRRPKRIQKQPPKLVYKLGRPTTSR
jgi:hypothetical protein